METNTNIINRSDVSLVAVSKGELIVLLEQLNNERELNNINMSVNFAKEILRLAIVGLEKSEKEEKDYEC